jgi:RNA polymerase subunit RPABC4/transcription elongation factor Spt4
METKPKLYRAPIKKTRPYLGLSIALGIVGLIALVFLSLWVGLLVILVAALIDRPKWLCGMCGNQIEKSTSICPHCQSRIVRK